MFLKGISESLQEVAMVQGCLGCLWKVVRMATVAAAHSRLERFLLAPQPLWIREQTCLRGGTQILGPSLTVQGVGWLTDSANCSLVSTYYVPGASLYVFRLMH